MPSDGCNTEVSKESSLSNSSKSNGNSNDPPYWSYTAQNVSFGLTERPILPPAMDNERRVDSQPGLDSIMSPWFLSNGAPSFASKCNLKRKRKQDEEQTLTLQIYEMGKAMKKDDEKNEPHRNRESLHRELSLLIKGEKKQTELLQQRICNAILKD